MNATPYAFPATTTPRVDSPVRAGFTLVEMLTVVAIIAVLSAILLPAVNKMLTEGKRARAATQVVAIANAIAAYRTEYGAWPGQTAQSPVDGTITRPLIYTNLVSNPRGKVFLETKESWLTTSGQPRLVDLWGNEVMIAMDENGDGNTDVSWSYVLAGGSAAGSTVAYATTVTGMPVVVCSWGPDPLRPASKTDKKVMSWGR